MDDESGRHPVDEPAPEAAFGCGAGPADVVGYLEWVEEGRTAGFLRAREHVDACAACAEDAHELGDTLGALDRDRIAAAVAPPPAIPEAIVDGVARSVRRDARRRRAGAALARAATFLLAGTVGVAGGVVLHSHHLGGGAGGGGTLTARDPSPGPAAPEARTDGPPDGSVPAGPALVAAPAAGDGLAPGASAAREAPADAGSRLVLAPEARRDLALFRLATEAAAWLRGEAAVAGAGAEAAADAAAGALALADDARRLAALYTAPEEASVRAFLTELAAALRAIAAGDAERAPGPEVRAALADALERLRVRLVLPPLPPEAGGAI